MKKYSEKNGSRMDMRALTLDLLLEAERGTEYESRILKDMLEKYDYLDGRDKAFFKRLSDGVTERRLQLDYVLEQFSSVPVRKMKPLIRCILRMGAYQILFMDGVPDSAACNEAVKLAKKRRFGQLSGFVNGGSQKPLRREGFHPLAGPGKENPSAFFPSVIPCRNGSSGNGRRNMGKAGRRPCWRLCWKNGL